MKIAVLCYHSNNILGNDYASNDHVALAQDLGLLRRLQLPVVDLRHAVAAARGERDLGFDRAVALSCDDGSWFDWFDLDHPGCGPQPGFRSVLLEARDLGQAVHLTSFVIVSPEAREELDRTCLVGRGWWGDQWWPQAAAGDLVAIENHSWDHNHDAIASSVQRDNARGRFDNIDTFVEAEAEIAQASDWLDARLPGQRTTLFAWPYGEVSEYVVRDYLPRHDHHRLRAAFTTEPKPIEAGTDPWLLGRYVCGAHWRSPGELERLLADALGR